MEQLKKFIDCFIPTETCNLHCHYCYIAQTGKFNNKLVKFPYPLDYIKRAFSKKRLGGVCLFNLCAGGETLLAKEVLELAYVLLEEGHYVMIVTNGTVSKRFNELEQFPARYRERLFFKFSYHYLELRRLNKIDEFFSNVNKAWSLGCSFTVEITPSDELIPYINDVKVSCQKYVGALCHVTVGRNDTTSGIDILTEYTQEEYMKIWSTFHSELFDFKMNIYRRKIKEFCYAGDWSLYINLGTGKIAQCYCGETLGNIYENINKKIKVNAIGNKCALPYCYNGHAFLALGDVPELNMGTYAILRNRVCSDGREWINPRMKSFMEQRLGDHNKEYSWIRKRFSR